MDVGSLITTPVNLMTNSAVAAASAAEMAKRGHIQKTAQDFEASFLSQMLQPMFEGLSSAPPFGGGAGEQMWTSFLAEAMAKKMAKTGGIGVSKAVAAEMLKMQGLTEAPAS